MKYEWDKELAPNTKVRLITRKNRRFTAISGKVVSHKNGQLIIKDDNDKEYIRKSPQKIFIKEYLSFKQLVQKASQK